MIKPCARGHTSKRGNGGQCKECAVLVGKIRYEKNRAKIAIQTGAYNKRYYAENRNSRRAFYLMREARKRAAKKKILFKLTAGDVAILQAAIDAGLCQLTGLPFVLEGWETGKRRSPFSPSLDRVKPELGYVHGNVRVVLWGLNAGLGDWGTDVYELIAKAFLTRTRMPWE